MHKAFLKNWYGQMSLITKACLIAQNGATIKEMDALMFADGGITSCSIIPAEGCKMPG